MPGPTIKLTFAGDSTDLEKSVDRVGKSVGGLEKTVKASSVGLAAAGAGAAAALSDAFSSSLEFDSAQAKLSAQLGGGQFAADMGKVAGELYANAYGESLGEVNEAVRAVVQSGAVMEDATDEQISNITGKVMSLAKAFDQDVSKATAGVAQMMKTGLAPDAETALDIITRGFQQGVDKSGDFLDTLNEYGTQFRKFGLDGATATGLLTQGLRAGARDADTVADAIKEFSIRAIDGSKTTAQGFKDIGLSAEDMAAKIAAGGPTATEALDLTLDTLRAIDDPIQKNAAGVALFGTKWEDLGESVNALDVSSAAAALGTVDGAAQKVNDTLQDTAANKIEAAKRGFTEWTSSIVGVDGPLGDFAANVVAVGPGLLETAGSLSMLVLAVQGLGLATPIATAAQWLWNAAMTANPIGLIIVAVAALVAAIVWIATQTTWFQDLWSFVWGGIQSAAGIAIDWVSDKINWLVGVFQSISSTISGVFSGIGDGIKGAFRGAFNFVADAWNNTVGSLSWQVPSWVPGIGGSNFSAPKLPKFHTGTNRVPGAPGSEMLAILQAGEKVTPAGKADEGGATVVFGSDGSKLGDAVLALVEAAVRKQGRGKLVTA